MHARVRQGSQVAEDPDWISGTEDRTSEAGTVLVTWALAAVLVGTVLLRLIRLDQPIVENYVGRQVPTAMVARNLERGSGFFRPQLDTAPFPNYFLGRAAGLSAPRGRRCGGSTGCRCEAAGRLVSALATALGAWGLFGLVRRREGDRVAFAAAVAFSLLPVTIRYGRAFQPDALMLGGVLAGLKCWDLPSDGRGDGWLIPGWLLAGARPRLQGHRRPFVLVPLGLVILRPRDVAGMSCSRARRCCPVLAWYRLGRSPGRVGAARGPRRTTARSGSRSSASRRWRAARRWLTSGGSFSSGRSLPSGWSWRPGGLACEATRDRAATRPLAGLGLARCWRRWRSWRGSCTTSITGWAWRRWWPWASAGPRRCWRRRHRGLAWGSGRRACSSSSAVLTRSTWRTPPEWQASSRPRRAGPGAWSRRAPGWSPRAAPLPGRPAGLPARVHGPAVGARRGGMARGRTDARSTDPLDLVEFYRRRRGAIRRRRRRRRRRRPANGLARSDPATLQGLGGPPVGHHRRTRSLPRLPGMASEDRPVTIPDFAALEDTRGGRSPS